MAKMTYNYEKLAAFAEWVTDCLFDENFDNLHDSAFGELAFRKLYKLGLVKINKRNNWEKENGRADYDRA